MWEYIANGKGNYMLLLQSDWKYWYILLSLCAGWKELRDGNRRVYVRDLRKFKPLFSVYIN